MQQDRFGCLILAVGIFVSLLSVWYYGKFAYISLFGESAVGSVGFLEKVHGQFGHTYIVYHFTVNDKQFKSTARLSYSWTEPENGKLGVKYLKSNPYISVVKGGFSLYYVILLVVGVYFTINGLKPPNKRFAKFHELYDRKPEAPNKGMNADQ